MNDIEKLRGSANRLMPAHPVVGCGLTFIGLTKREMFAAMAMQGMLACENYSGTLEAYSKASVEHADALLNELEKKP